MTFEDQVVIGRIARPHGVTGELKVRPFTESADTFMSFKEILVRCSGGNEKRYRLVGRRVHKEFVLLKLKDVNTRDQAEALVGCEVTVHRDRLPKAEENEFYWTDLIGLAVQDLSGRDLGRVENLLRPGPDDLLVIKSAKGEWMIPFRAEIVSDVDLDARLIRIDPPEGLMDL